MSNDHLAQRLATALDAVSSLDLDGLREAWRTRFKTAPPAHRSRDLLVRAYAYGLQAEAQGGISRGAKRRLEDLAQRFAADRNFRPSAAASLSVGTVLVRDWNGRRCAVTVVEGGFLFEGACYASLSAVAFAITGVKWSGPRFFRERDGEDEGASP